MCGFYGPGLCISSPNKPGEGWEKLPREYRTPAEPRASEQRPLKKNLVLKLFIVLRDQSGVS